MDTKIPGSGVRPTRSTLNDLGVPVPNLGIPLESLDHELVVRAQQLPQKVAGGGAERIVSLDDRVWLKVKTEAWRGAVTHHEVLDNLESEAAGTGCWWLGAAGTRRADSGHTDFYEQLARGSIARRKAANVGGANITTNTLTDHLQPDAWDRDRLRAELTTHATRKVRTLVRDMAAESLRTGKIIGFGFRGWQVRVLIRAENGHEANIAIAALGMADPDTFALLLTSIPGLNTDDWMPEPGGAAGLTPNHGEILWSAMLPPEVASALLDDDTLQASDTVTALRLL